MYKLLLILKYLRKRRLAWISLIAVTLCTAMVLVVISVMGGWLKTFREQFRNLSSDVIVKGDAVGFPDYELMIDRIEKLPEVKAAVPVIQTYGLVRINGKNASALSVVGYPPDIGRVNSFPDSLFKRRGEQPVNFGLHPDVSYLPPPGYRGRDVKTWSGIIMGSGVIGLKKNQTTRVPWMYQSYVDVTVVPVGSSGLEIESKARNFFWIVDDSRTKVHLVDSKTVYVPFEVLQKDLLMDGDEGKGKRTSEIQVALKPGADLTAAHAKIQEIANQVASEQGWAARFTLDVYRWDQLHALYLGQIEKEKGLMTILFGIISLVAVFLIFCIFYMIVAEKTRDIGIIKSVGAGSGGVAGIFLGYGIAIGFVGGGLGLLIAWLIVRNINTLHDFLSRHGVVVYNPEVYIFEDIPSRMDPFETTVIVSIAIVASIFGALVPAIRAARLHPIEALRWE